MIVAAAAVAVAVAAGGTTAYLYVSHRNDDKKITGSPVTPPASAPASATATQPAQAFPADTMLIRVDTGDATGPGRKSKVYYFTPGQQTRTPLPNTQTGDVLPKWSHDRKRIAITHVSEDGKSSSIVIANADGSNRETVINNAGGRVAWSADDQKIAFMKKAPDGVSQIYVLDLNTRNLRQLTHSSIQKDDAMWSPDGKTIIYWLNKDNVKQIYELNVANPSEPGTQITGPKVGPANDPVYSPNGEQILFTRELHGVKGDIWLVNRDGSDPHRVTTNPALEMDPTWSPDGKWFAFVRGDYGHPSIVIQKPDGTGETTLTTGGAREAHPCWF
jgi:Tol biopolymer transport system component